jgi:kynurenine formamidase
VVHMALQSSTHWDALSHVTYDGRMFNGHSPDAITFMGATRCGIEKVASIAGRGVLLDVARAQGLEYIDEAYVITPEDLDATAEAQGVDIRSGDILLLRTGHIKHLKEGDKVRYIQPTPGPGMEAVRWFRRHDIAAVAADNMTLEVWPSEDGMVLPVHALDLVEMGLFQGQNFDLDELAAACAADGRYDFFLSAQPERFVGGVGSVTNPVAFR